MHLCARVCGCVCVSARAPARTQLIDDLCARLRNVEIMMMMMIGIMIPGWWHRAGLAGQFVLSCAPPPPRAWAAPCQCCWRRFTSWPRQDNGLVRRLEKPGSRRFSWPCKLSTTTTASAAAAATTHNKLLCSCLSLALVSIKRTHWPLLGGKRTAHTILHTHRQTHTGWNRRGGQGIIVVFVCVNGAHMTRHNLPGRLVQANQCAQRHATAS